MITHKGKKYNTLDDVHNKWIKKASYKQAYGKLDFEFALIRAIIETRLKKGITQKELARRVGTKQSSIARFESGTYNPTLSFVQKLATAMNAKIQLA